ncbi:hypothetical protein [Anaerovibrio sp.]|uniref:hypothetical protein n=1 Tax=Anaerovibrio sp. TaxID=1872532 RepID=UPI00388F59D1
MIKKLLLIVCMLLLATTALAFPKVENSDAILADMKANPSRYVRFGGASVGQHYYIDKISINVHKYEPPEYIIAARWVTRSYVIAGENVYEDIRLDTTMRYKYDYDQRKMYFETTDENGNLIWKHIDPSLSKSYHDDNYIAAGEILFYLAYNMSFYDKIATHCAREYIESH